MSVVVIICFALLGYLLGRLIAEVLFGSADNDLAELINSVDNLIEDYQKRLSGQERQIVLLGETIQEKDNLIKLLKIELETVNDIVDTQDQNIHSLKEEIEFSKFEKQESVETLKTALKNLDPTAFETTIDETPLFDEVLIGDNNGTEQDDERTEGRSV